MSFGEAGYIFFICSENKVAVSILFGATQLSEASTTQSKWTETCLVSQVGIEPASTL